MQVIGRAHQLLGKVIGHAARVRLLVVGLEEQGPRLQSLQTGIQSLNVGIGGLDLAVELVEAFVAQPLDILG